LRSADTDPAAERVQVELLRHATVARRAALARSLSCMVLQLTQRAIQARNPTADADQLAVEFIATCYGPVLASGVRGCLEARRRLHESAPDSA